MVNVARSLDLDKQWFLAAANIDVKEIVLGHEQRSGTATIGK
jgi:6-phosphofructokinase